MSVQKYTGASGGHTCENARLPVQIAQVYAYYNVLYNKSRDRHRAKQSNADEEDEAFLRYDCFPEKKNAAYSQRCHGVVGSGGFDHQT